MSTEQMPTFIFAGELEACWERATDPEASALVREVFGQHFADLAGHWLIGEKECRRLER